MRLLCTSWLVLLTCLHIGCRERAPAVSPAPDVASPPVAPSVEVAEQACVDAWLGSRRLDPYGSPEGTMYTGGTPLFDERPGHTTDRLAYVYDKHPAAQSACARR